MARQHSILPTGICFSLEKDMLWETDEIYIILKTTMKNFQAFPMPMEIFDVCLMQIMFTQKLLYYLIFILFEAQFKTAWICLTLVLEWVHHWIPNDENRQNCGHAENWVRSSPANLSTCSWSILGLTLGLWAYSTSAPLSACTWPESGPLAEQCWKTWTPRCSVHTGLVWYVQQVC